jgi:hypothetical protein
LLFFARQHFSNFFHYDYEFILRFAFVKKEFTALGEF